MTNGFIAGPQSQNGPSAADISRQVLAQAQGRNNGLDFTSLTTVPGVQGYQEPLPGLDFQWLWQNETQAAFALTIRSMRGGLNMQRDNIEKAHVRQASSSLVSHARDELILAFDYEQQTNHQAVFSNYNVLHCMFKDRLVMAPFLGPGESEFKVFAETSATDPTIKEINFGATAGPIYVFSIGTARYGGTEYFLMMTNGGTLVVDDLESPTTGTTILAFNTLITPSEAPVYWQDTVVGPAATVSGFGWTGGHSATYQAIVGMSFVQSPLPGNPLIVRGNDSFILVPTEVQPGSNAPIFGQTASLMLKKTGLGNHQALGFVAAGGRQSRAYWWETNNGGPAVDGSFKSRISSCNAYGADYQVHEMSLNRIIGAAALRRRGKLGLTDGYQVITWDGSEDDLGIFNDEAPSDSYTLFCTGLYEDSGQLYVEINELPRADNANQYGESIGQGRIRACKRRYDFDLKKWHQISDWLTLTDDGLIRWFNGVPIPVGDPTDLHYGFMSCYGAPDLPFAKTTRTMHNHMMPPRYSTDLSQRLGLPITGQYEATWTNKFEPTAGQNPYSFRGSDKDFASGGVARTPGLIWNGEARYANKYFDEIEWGGVDSGGADSKVIVRIGEYDHMDDVDSAGNRPVLEHEFKNGLSHDQRRRRFGANRTAHLFPQIEIEIVRGSDHTLTMQALPITLYGHVDFPVHDFKPAQTPVGRSKA